jgi:NAD-dependent deacetylase
MVKVPSELITRAARDLINAKYAIALTGAGISTESGIRDFRGPDGIWTKNPEMERRAYEAYDLFLKDPKRYWEENLSSPPLLGDITAVKPNSGHYALADLERAGILKCLITQNIDNLHQRAGSKKVIDYHGNISNLRCVRCNIRFPFEEYDLEGLKESGNIPPRCKKCSGILKPDVVHFKEPIPIDVSEQSTEEAMVCDLMLICGTSAVVYPFANLPRVARQKSTGFGGYYGLYSPADPTPVIVIEVNAEPTPLTEEGISNYLIQGKTGEILPRIMAEVEKLL